MQHINARHTLRQNKNDPLIENVDRFQCVSMSSDPHNLFPRMFTIHSCIPDVHDTRNSGSK